MTLELDQTVWVKPVGNNARRGMNTDPIEATVSKIGRKYFELNAPSAYGNKFSGTKFHLDSGQNVSDYSARYKVYETKQEISDEARCGLLRNKIQAFFNRCGKNGTLSQLEAIAEILELETEASEPINL